MAATWLQKRGLRISDPEHALICLHCKVALRTQVDLVLQHLVEKHDGKRQIRHVLAHHLASAQLNDVCQLQSRIDGSIEEQDLSTSPGLACGHCDNRTTSEQLLRRHLSSQHGILWCAAVVDRDYRHVSLQCWTQGGLYRGQWWIVRTSPTATRMALLTGGIRGSRASKRRRRRQLEKPGSPRENRRLLHLTSTSTALPSFLSQVHEVERWQLARESILAPLPSVPDHEASPRSPWLERTGWADAFGWGRRDILLALTQLPSRWTQQHGYLLGEVDGREHWSSAEDEQRIQCVLTLVDVVFDRCEETVRRTGRPILCRLRSRDPVKAHRLPFQLVLRASSRNKYRRFWKRLLALALRYVHIPRHVADSILCVPFTPTQWTLIGDLWNLPWQSLDGLDTLAAGVDDNSVDSDDAAHEEIDTNVGSGDRGAYDEAEADVVEDTEDSEESYDTDEGVSDDEWDSMEENHSDPFDVSRPSSSQLRRQMSELIFQLSVSWCCDEFLDGQPLSSTLMYFSGIVGFTPNGQGFQQPRQYTPTISALIHLQMLLLLEYALPSRPYRNLGWPARPAQNHLARLEAVRQQYMCMGCLTPLGELRDLLTCGRGMLHIDGPAFFVRWSDDGQTIFFSEHRLHLNQFRHFAHTLVDSVTSLGGQLMGHWRPDVQLDSIQDDFTNTVPGYSFVTDCRNGLKSAFLQLSARVGTFGPNPLVSHEQWAEKAVSEYLHVHEEFLSVLFQLCFVTCGQDPRVKELMTLEVYNGSMHPRGVFVYNGSMVYITHYHKAQRNTNRQFHVARFFPLPASRWVFYYLVYIRRFVEMLLRSCFRVAARSNHLFVSNPIVARQPLHRHWDTKDLTRLLRASSQQVLGCPLGVQMYRQITIAMTNKHLRFLARRINLYDDRSKDASIDAVFAWQSGHRPLTQGTNYGLDGAFPHTLQPELLRLYEWASSEWHRFLELPSKSTMQSTGIYGHRHYVEPLQTEAQTEPPLAEPSHRLVNQSTSVNLRARPPLEEIHPNTNLSVHENKKSSIRHNNSAIRRKEHYQEVVASHNTQVVGQSRRIQPKGVECWSDPTERPIESPPLARKSLPSSQALESELNYTFDAFFIHLPKYRIIVCHACPRPFAVVPSQIAVHLQNHHSHVGLAARQQMVQMVDQMPNLARQPDEVIYPAPWDDPIEGLPLYDDGLRCLGTFSSGHKCERVLRSVAAMQRHCKQEHDWVNQQQRGGNTRQKQRHSPNRLWQEGQYCQTFFLFGTWRQSFHVWSQKHNEHEPG